MRSCEFLSRVFRFQCEFIRRVAMLNSPVITPRSRTFSALKFHRKRTVIRPAIRETISYFQCYTQSEYQYRENFSRRTVAPSLRPDDPFAQDDRCWHGDIFTRRFYQADGEPAGNFFPAVLRDSELRSLHRGSCIIRSCRTKVKTFVARLTPLACTIVDRRAHLQLVIPKLAATNLYIQQRVSTASALKISIYLLHAVLRIGAKCIFSRTDMPTE